jgi:hypothetical protein
MFAIKTATISARTFVEQCEQPSRLEQLEHRTTPLQMESISRCLATLRASIKVAIPEASMDVTSDKSTVTTGGRIARQDGPQAIPNVRRGIHVNAAFKRTTVSASL